MHEFHITIQFLGDNIGKDATLKVIEALRKIKFKPFNIKIGDATPFPNQFNPKGVWIECENSEALTDFADKIRNAMGKLRLIADKPFTPHITLGRYKNPPPKKPEKVKGLPHSFTVDEFYLMESFLESGGPRYKVVAGFVAKNPVTI